MYTFSFLLTPIILSIAWNCEDYIDDETKFEQDKMLMHDETEINEESMRGWGNKTAWCYWKQLENFWHCPLSGCQDN